MRNARVLCGVLILACAWALGAWAAGPSPSGVASCRSITDDKQRLACFDRESAAPQQPTPSPQQLAPVGQQPAPEQQPTRGGDAARTTAATASSAPPRPSLTPEQRMGLTPDRILKLQGSAETRELKELTAKVQGVSGDPDSRRYFTLENGQVWRQVEADPEFTVRAGDSVRITKAMFGSYFMSVDRHMSTRVSRAR